MTYLPQIKAKEKIMTNANEYLVGFQLVGLSKLKL